MGRLRGRRFGVALPTFITINLLGNDTHQPAQPTDLHLTLQNHLTTYQELSFGQTQTFVEAFDLLDASWQSFLHDFGFFQL